MPFLYRWLPPPHFFHSWNSRFSSFLPRTALSSRASLTWKAEWWFGEGRTAPKSAIRFLSKADENFHEPLPYADRISLCARVRAPLSQTRKGATGSNAQPTGMCQERRCPGRHTQKPTRTARLSVHVLSHKLVKAVPGKTPFPSPGTLKIKPTAGGTPARHSSPRSELHTGTETVALPGESSVF